MRFVLASSSPARLQTLRAAGVDPEVVVSGVDEDRVTAPTTAQLVLALARAKAAAVAARLVGPPALVLGCDSLLELDGVPLGKPHDADDARARWQALSGRSGVLHTGHALRDPERGELVEGSATVVHFAEVDAEEVEAYLATGEPLAVAGAFTVDGLGGWFVRGVEGDHHGVVGLSLPLLRDMLRRLGRPLSDLGWPAR